MNDRFKFRVWDKHHKTFLVIPYGNYALSDDGELFWLMSNCDCSELDTEDYIIEQCTGLRDKNGKLIYEGDFLKDHNGIWQVLWDEKEAAFYIYNKKRDFYLSPFIGEFEIIGNIHDNEELLK